METRIEKLEEFAVEVRAELRSIDVRLTKIEVILPTLATKADLELLRRDTRTDIESLKVHIHKTAAETQKWVVATIIGMFLGFGGLLLGMSNALKPVIHLPPAVTAPPAVPATVP